MLSRANVAMLEQPIAAGADAELAGFAPDVPICADESLHEADDLAHVAERYQIINIKLDKTGGLTAALHLADAARALGLGVMTGCMVSSSLSMAPALHLAAGSDFVDLDGPWWLAADRPGGLRIVDGRIILPDPGFWGGGPRQCTAAAFTTSSASLPDNSVR
jgi:L-alanine-DL-glutamate epimerase-like enolase superfamily enzyme